MKILENILEKFKIIKRKEKEFFIMIMEISTLEILKMINMKEKEFFII